MNEAGRWRRFSRIARRLDGAARTLWRPAFAGGPSLDRRCGADPTLQALLQQALNILDRSGEAEAAAIRPSGKAVVVRMVRQSASCATDRQGPPVREAVLLASCGAAGAEERRQGRIGGLDEEAAVVFRGLESRARLLDLSPQGMMLRAEFVPEIGEPVTVRRAGGTGLRYFVRWVRDGQIGLGCREDDILADPGRASRRADGVERLGFGLARAAHLVTGAGSPRPA